MIKAVNTAQAGNYEAMQEILNLLVLILGYGSLGWWRYHFYKGKGSTHKNGPEGRFMERNYYAPTKD